MDLILCLIYPVRWFGFNNWIMILKKTEIWFIWNLLGINLKRGCNGNKSLNLIKLKLKKICYVENNCKWTKCLIGWFIWCLSLSFSNSSMIRHLLISSKVLILHIFLPESHGGNKVLTIQEFSSDELMDARDPP